MKTSSTPEALQQQDDVQDTALTLAVQGLWIKNNCDWREYL